MLSWFEKVIKHPDAIKKKKKSEEENITRQLSEAQKNQALSHIATADIITGLLLPQMKRSKSCFMLWSILLV